MPLQSDGYFPVVTIVEIQAVYIAVDGVEYLHPHAPFAQGADILRMLPEVQFHLVDSIGKKIKVGQAVAEAIGLKNVTFRHCRAEEEKQLFDFVVSRAVMPLADLVKIARKNIKKEQQNALPNGLICLKGGELQHEILPFHKQAVSLNLSDHFKEEFFQTKKVVYVPL